MANLRNGHRSRICFWRQFTTRHRSQRSTNCSTYKERSKGKLRRWSSTWRSVRTIMMKLRTNYVKDMIKIRRFCQHTFRHSLSNHRWVTSRLLNCANLRWRQTKWLEALNHSETMQWKEIRGWSSSFCPSVTQTLGERGQRSRTQNKRCDTFEFIDSGAGTTLNSKKTVQKQTRSLHVKDIQCPQCKQSHYLAGCPRFKEMSVISRREFVNQHKLCFNCMTAGHSHDLFEQEQLSKVQ